MAFLGLGQGLEPIGDLVKTFLAGGAGHAGIHIRIFMGLAGHGCLQIQVGGANGLPRCRITGFFQEFQMAVGMAGLAFRGGAENGGHIVVAFHVGLLRKIQITPVGLAFTGKCVF